MEAFQGFFEPGTQYDLTVLFSLIFLFNLREWVTCGLTCPLDKWIAIFFLALHHTGIAEVIMSLNPVGALAFFAPALAA